MIIPRAQISIKYKEILGFLFNLFLTSKKNNNENLVEEFERKYAENFNFPHGVAFAKARAALFFLLKNLNLKPGGEVIISAIHVADFVNIIHCAGFKPVVADVNPETYAVDYDDLEKKITGQTVLLFITHLSGFVTDMERIMEISRKYNLPIVEDCSQALNSFYRGKRLGTFGAATIFSLSLLKPVSAFFGGLVISKDEKLLEKMRREKENIKAASKLPLAKEAIKHIVIKIATEKFIFAWAVFPLLRVFSAPFDFLSRYQRYNKTVILRSKLPESYFVKFTWQQAKLGLKQLATFKEREDKKIRNGEYLYSLVKDRDKIRKARLISDSRNSFWTFPLYAENIIDFKKYLARHGIDSTAYLLSVLGDELSFKPFGFINPKASLIKKHTLLAPIYYQLDKKQIEYMADIINKY